MYNDELEPIKVKIDDIFLDANNPRLWGKEINRTISEKRIIDEKIQVRTLEFLKSHGIEDLLNSILRNGFLPLDRIVIREISGEINKYVVVEGNRRLAALKVLRNRISEGLLDEEGINETYLEKLYESTNELNVLLYKGSDSDISWMLQGIRHISGVRDWSPAQQAKLVVDRVDNHGLSYTQAGQEFGISAQKVGKLYRTYKALMQMKQDDEYSNKAENKYFTLFEQATSNTNIKNWLGWDNSNNRFSNDNNLKLFYSLITPDESAPDHSENGRRIHDPRHVNKLGAVVASENSYLLDKIDNWNIDIEKAYEKANELDISQRWEDTVDDISDLIGSIPSSAISDSPEAFLQGLDKIQSGIDKLRKMAQTLIEK